MTDDSNNPTPSTSSRYTPELQRTISSSPEILSFKNHKDTFALLDLKKAMQSTPRVISPAYPEFSLAAYYDFFEFSRVMEEPWRDFIDAAFTPTPCGRFVMVTYKTQIFTYALHSDGSMKLISAITCPRNVRAVSRVETKSEAIMAIVFEDGSGMVASQSQPQFRPGGYVRIIHDYSIEREIYGSSKSTCAFRVSLCPSGCCVAIQYHDGIRLYKHGERSKYKYLARTVDGEYAFFFRSSTRKQSDGAQDDHGHCKSELQVIRANAADWTNMEPGSIDCIRSLSISRFGDAESHSNDALNSESASHEGHATDSNTSDVNNTDSADVSTLTDDEEVLDYRRISVDTLSSTVPLSDGRHAVSFDNYTEALCLHRIPIGSDQTFIQPLLVIDVGRTVGYCNDLAVSWDLEHGLHVAAFLGETIYIGSVAKDVLSQVMETSEELVASENDCARSLEEAGHVGNDAEQFGDHKLFDNWPLKIRGMRFCTVEGYVRLSVLGSPDGPTIWAFSDKWEGVQAFWPYEYQPGEEKWAYNHFVSRCGCIHWG